MRLAAIAIFLSGLAWAQTGVLRATVTDPNGDGVVAQLQARNTATGAVYKAVSAAKGVYTLSRLPAGAYDITIPPIGFTFNKYEQKGVAVRAGDTASLDIHLPWGGNLGTPGDDFSLLVPGKGSAKGPAPRGRDGKPDLSGVWVGNAPEVDTPELLPWAEAVTKQRRGEGTRTHP